MNISILTNYQPLQQGFNNSSDVKNSILENNLFGVDINEESIEIAKSLWLRTAEKGRKLTSLNDKINGNSLIDNIDIAEKKHLIGILNFLKFL